jgi:hypothetical protein
MNRKDASSEAVFLIEFRRFTSYPVRAFQPDHSRGTRSMGQQLRVRVKRKARRRWIKRKKQEARQKRAAAAQSSTAKA